MRVARGAAARLGRSLACGPSTSSHSPEGKHTVSRLHGAWGAQEQGGRGYICGPSLRPDCATRHRPRGPPALRPTPDGPSQGLPALRLTPDGPSQGPPALRRHPMGLLSMEAHFLRLSGNRRSVHVYSWPLCSKTLGPKLGPNFSQGVWQTDGRSGFETRASLTLTEWRPGPLGPMNQLRRGRTLSPGDRADSAGPRALWIPRAPGPTLACSPITQPGCLNPLAQAWGRPHSPVSQRPAPGVRLGESTSFAWIKRRRGSRSCPPCCLGPPRQSPRLHRDTKEYPGVPRASRLCLDTRPVHC